MKHLLNISSGQSSPSEDFEGNRKEKDQSKDFQSLNNPKYPQPLSSSISVKVVQCRRVQEGEEEEDEGFFGFEGVPEEETWRVICEMRFNGRAVMAFRVDFVLLVLLVCVSFGYVDSEDGELETLFRLLHCLGTQKMHESFELSTELAQVADISKPLLSLYCCPLSLQPNRG